MLLVELEALVVRDGAGVAEVVDATQLSLGESEGGREQVVQDRHGVRDIDHFFVLANLRDEVSRRQVVRDGHAHA